MTYNSTGKRITSENLAGQVTTTAWDCCFAYANNTRSELTNAVAAVDSDYRYAYDFDDIGNRESSSERGTNSVYTANSLNQYTAVNDFTPQFDDDGNQTLIKTATGVWQVAYNGENRPVLWTCGETNVVMSYDRLGRRVEYLETAAKGNGTVSTNAHYRFVYDGYLCIQRLDAAAGNAIDLVFDWDPANPVATRPLMIEKPSQYTLFVAHDGGKSVSDLILCSGGSGVAAHYEYAPFGALTASSRSTSDMGIDFRKHNPFRFSSEYADDTIGLVYYNYRHYDCESGKMTSREPFAALPYLKNDFIVDYSWILANVYRYVSNNPVNGYDFLGREPKKIDWSGRREIEGPSSLLNSKWLLFPYILPVDPNDVYGHYCGACRINGRLFGGDEQKGWRSSEIGEGREYRYIDKDGKEQTDWGRRPKDKFDKCCETHDKCLADVDFGNLSPIEKSEAIKKCDVELAGCWLKAYFTETSLSLVARTKLLLAMPAMVGFAHLGDIANIAGDRFNRARTAASEQLRRLGGAAVGGGRRAGDAIADGAEVVVDGVRDIWDAAQPIREYIREGIAGGIEESERRLANPWPSERDPGAEECPPTCLFKVFSF